jgi:hypothetical protein
MRDLCTGNRAMTRLLELISSAACCWMDRVRGPLPDAAKGLFLWLARAFGLAFVLLCFMPDFWPGALTLVGDLAAGGSLLAAHQ